MKNHLASIGPRSYFMDALIRYNISMRKTVRIITIVVIALFALAGFILIGGYIALRLGITKTSGKIDLQQTTFLPKDASAPAPYKTFPLAHTPEWIAFRIAVTKDKAILARVEKETGIEQRLLVAILVPEQMRLYHSNRPLFKEVFEPLKVLGSQSQFSWGIYGIKDETARAVERQLTDKNSIFFPGSQYAHLLDFNTQSPDQERFARIVNEHNHYYAYLYTALFLDEVQSQWAQSGFSINNRPDILATLWNLGFEKSRPNASPQSGGSTMEIGDSTLSFGALANDFYKSDELVEIFPLAAKK